MNQHYLAVAIRILTSDWQLKWKAHQPFPILGRERWFSGVADHHSFFLVAIEPAPPTHPDHYAGSVETYVSTREPTRRVILHELLSWAEHITGPCEHCGRKEGDPAGSIDGIGVNPYKLLLMRGLEKGGATADVYVPKAVAEAPIMFFGDGWIFGVMGRTDSHPCPNFETGRAP